MAFLVRLGLWRWEDLRMLEHQKEISLDSLLFALPVFGGLYGTLGPYNERAFSGLLLNGKICGLSSMARIA